MINIYTYIHKKINIMALYDSHIQKKLKTIKNVAADYQSREVIIAFVHV